MVKEAIFVLRFPDGRPGVYTFVNHTITYEEGFLTAGFIAIKVSDLSKTFNMKYELHNIIRID